VALAQLQVIDGLEVELGSLADLAQGDVVLVGLAIRGAGVREVGQRAEQLVAALI
jgi:hypothetical protein